MKERISNMLKQKQNDYKTKNQKIPMYLKRENVYVNTSWT